MSLDDVRQSAARKFHLFSGNSGPARIRDRSAAGHFARPACDRRRRTPGSLEDVYLQTLARLPEMSVILYPDPKDDERAIYVPVEPCDPFTEAVRTALEIDAEVIFIEPDSGDRPHLPDTYPDPYSIRYIGLNQYIEAYRVYPQDRNEEIAGARGRHGVEAAGRRSDGAGVCGGLAESAGPGCWMRWRCRRIRPRRTAPPDIRLLNPHPDCLAEITVEYPYLQDRYELFRPPDGPEELIVDRPKVQFDLLREAEKEYVKNTGDKIEYWQRRMLARFTRNLASISGDLMAGVFDLTVAARSVVDDNYAYEVWQMANRYPAQKAGQQFDGNRESVGRGRFGSTPKSCACAAACRVPSSAWFRAGLKERKKEKFEGEWARQTDGTAICSYPPEDLVIEDYGRFLKRKAKSMLSEERSRTEPFTTSILDGIDLRETIRNWHEAKIYVRQLDRIAGEVGATVVIFDEDPDDRYQYLTTWLGEHQNESDMAFYSTHPFQHLVGPGIGRAEYGGFLMTLPPRRMLDVWTDPDYDFAQNKPERLLMAALDYSKQRFVVYVAAKPPRSIFRSIAAHLNRRIIYIPIGALNPHAMKKLRVVHVLDSYERRDEAKDYIW